MAEIYIYIFIHTHTHRWHFRKIHFILQSNNLTNSYQILTACVETILNSMLNVFFLVSYRNAIPWEKMLLNIKHRIWLISTHGVKIGDHLNKNSSSY